MEYNATRSRQNRIATNNNLPRGLTNDILCTHGIPQEDGTYSGACRSDGDAGAPLYINEEIDSNGDISGRTLAAIFSGSKTCGSTLEPQFWNRISTHLEWIKCTSKIAGANPDVGDLHHIAIWRRCQHHAPDNPCWDRISHE